MSDTSPTQNKHISHLGAINT